MTETTLPVTVLVKSRSAIAKVFDAVNATSVSVSAAAAWPDVTVIVGTSLVPVIVTVTV